MTASLTLPAPAKLNLFLHVLSQREDGYHQLQTVFQLIDWCDYLTFDITHDKAITVSTNADLEPTDNLVYKAAKTLQQHSETPLGCQIKLQKNIPIGAGLGGGSSDAATTLLALRHLWKLPLTLDELSILGASLGADIPVFIQGHSAWGEGIGDQLTPLSLKPQWYLILSPNCAIQTKQLFEHPDLPRNTTPIQQEEYSVGKGHNDFTTLVINQYPEVKEAYDWLNNHAKGLLTGTGACVFAAFKDQPSALKILNKTPAHWQPRVVQGLQDSPAHVLLSKTNPQEKK